MSDAEFLPYAEARARVMAAAHPLPAVRLPLAALAGRALRETIRAPHDLPPFANSAMDGYAVRAADTAGATPGTPVELPVVGVIAAGRVAARPLGAGKAMRIMTGAAIPEGADAVVPFEDTTRAGDAADERVRVNAAAHPGAHVRRAGADLARGATALEAGRALSPHDIGLLAALGRDAALAGPRPRVAILSTGDELLAPADALVAGAIRDSNRPMLAALVEAAGGEVALSEHLRDERDEVATAIRRALGAAEVVLTIGGVSAGDFDPVKEAIDAIGGIALWRVAMRPGRPQAFGAREGRLFFGLPGNPASVACVFEALVRPALRAMQGFGEVERPRIAVRAAALIESRAGRVDFVRVRLAQKDGAWWATPAGAQISGHLTPQAFAHALAIVPAAAATIDAGVTLDAWLLRWPGSETVSA
jgi:molybdopterin molybdotransferase